MKYADDPTDDGVPPVTDDPLMLDELTAERLLDEPSPESAPPGYVTVASLLLAASGPPLDEELAGQDAALLAFAGALPRLPDRRPRPIRARWAGAGIAGVLLLSASAAAAATGSLPGPAQDAISDALGSVGISVPSSTDGHHGGTGTGVDEGKGKDRGANGNHTGVDHTSNPPGNGTDHSTTASTGVDEGKGNAGTNNGANGNHTGVDHTSTPPTHGSGQPPKNPTTPSTLVGSGKSNNGLHVGVGNQPTTTI